MARLLTKQKTLKDSIDYYHNSESYYKEKAKDAMRGDTTKVHSLIDSITMSYICGRADETQLKTVEFSIDSLSKMK